MGNMGSNNRKYPADDGSSWATMPHSPSGTNGLILNNVGLPEELVELILSFCDLDSIKTVTQVCQLWKTLTTRVGFWKSVYTHHGIDWQLIPDSHKNDVENSWCLLYVGLKNDGFQKNFIKNGSGEMGFQHWNLHDDRQCIIVESPPVGCNELADEPNSCFTTSYVWSSITQPFSIPFSPQLLKLMAPFEFQFSAQFAARFDCGGKGILEVEFSEDINDTATPLQKLHQLKIDKMEGETEWQSVVVSAVFDGRRLDYSRPELAITLSGKDNKFWAGHYGLKFSRISARIKLLDRAEGLASINHPYKIVGAE